jgi:hypothetical protein
MNRYEAISKVPQELEVCTFVPLHWLGFTSSTPMLLKKPNAAKLCKNNASSFGSDSHIVKVECC